MIPSLLLIVVRILLLPSFVLPALLEHSPTIISHPARPSFLEVSTSVGLTRPYGERRKYGVACVTDQNRDGYEDLLFRDHDARWSGAYFNHSNKTFLKSTWAIWVDGHGYTDFRSTPWQDTLHFIVTRGGQRNNKPNTPELFRVFLSSSTRGASATTLNAITSIILSTDADMHARGGGRSALVVHLRESVNRPDLIMLNAPQHGMAPFSNTLYSVHDENAMIFKNISSSLWHGFSSDHNYYALATDINRERGNHYISRAQSR